MTLILPLIAATMFVPLFARVSEKQAPTRPGTESVRAMFKKTNNKTLEGWLRSRVTSLEGQNGQWTFVYGGADCVVLTDERHGRMRLMTPLVDADTLTVFRLRELMEANFDKALDARFALWRGKLWSVFIHPLPTLGEDEFASALRQVSTLAANHGTTDSSGELQFGAE